MAKRQTGDQKWGEARRSLQEALKYDPQSLPALRQSIDLYLHEGKEQQAADEIQKLAMTGEPGSEAIYEAMECLGGNGYVEDAVLARLYREAPVNSIWEGSGNVMCLDVLRALAREPGALPSLLGELDAAAGGNDHFDHALARLRAELADLDRVEVRGRRIVELMAVTLQASLLVRHAPAAVADAFCTSRLDGAAGSKGLAFGTLPPDTAFAEIIGRAMPESPAGRGISR